MLAVDIYLVIAQKLQFLTLINFLKTCRTLWNLRDRIEYYSFAASYYQQLVEKRRWEAGMFEAIANEDLEMVQFFERKGNICWNDALKAATTTRFPTDNLIIKYMEQKGADTTSKWNCGMYGAAEVGNTQLVHYFIGKGANNFNEGLLYAAHGGHMDLVKFFLGKMEGHGYLLEAIEEAATGGCLEVLKLLTELSKDENKYCNWWKAARFNRKHILDYVRTQHEMCNNCMHIAVCEASKGNHRSLLEELFACNHGKIKPFWKHVYAAAAGGGHKELAKYAWEQPDNEGGNENMWIGLALYEASCHGETEMIKWLLPQYEWGDNAESVGVILAAAKSGWRDILDIVTEYAKDKLTWRHFSFGFTGAVQGDNVDIMEHFIKLLKPLNRYEPDTGLWLAAERGHWHLVDYFLEQGATDLKRAASEAWYAGHKDLYEYLSKRQKKRRRKSKNI